MKTSHFRSARGALLGALCLALLPSAVGCLDRPIAPSSPRTSNTLTDRVSVTAVDKIDLLFMIDNSGSMADKQRVLAKAVPDLVNRLINPDCVAEDAQGVVRIVSKPASPGEACPAGSEREFPPIDDIHIGVITSSMGSHGSDVCVGATDRKAPGQSTSCGGGSANFTCNDGGHLINRGERTQQDAVAFPDVSTSKSKGSGDAGFFAWDPKGKQDPPGDSDAQAMITRFTQVVLGADQIGCGYEASLEAWYRFLIDPRPPAVIRPPAKVGEPAVVEGVDEVLLKQRADFLRPDSLVAIINLSDENDCSVMEGVMPATVCDEPRLDERGFPVGCLSGPAGWPAGYVEGNFQDLQVSAEGRVTGTPFPANYLTMQEKEAPGGDYFHLASGTPECATDPGSPGCKSCYLGGQGCQPQDHRSDSRALRCWDQKRRFGVDFLYPTRRYVDGLRQGKIYDRDGYLVANPLFDDLPYNQARAAGAPLGRAKAPARDARQVFYASIVGVPWQDIAIDPEDLRKGYRSVGEEGLSSGPTIDWGLILGDPASRDADRQKPRDPLMQEATGPRSGVHPITGETIGLDGWNRINGHEWRPAPSPSEDMPTEDLQYACIFSLPSGDERACPSDDEERDPLCEGVAADGKSGNGVQTKTQTRAKAYPGTRFLRVAKDFGQNAIVASICTPNLTDAKADDFGYRPAVRAIVDRMKTQLSARCLPRRLASNPDGTTPCIVVDARFPQAPGAPADPAEVEACRRCDGPARRPLDPEIQANLAADTRAYGCLCEVTRIQQPANLTACRTDRRQQPSLPDASEEGGWCYVDPAAAPAAEKEATEAVVARCPDNEKRTIRFVNAGVESSTLFITCLGAASGS